MRTVITENTVSASVQIASKEFSRLDEQFEALEWRLAHRPENGVALKDGYMVYRQARVLSNLPELTVVYTYTDHQVNILAIRIMP
jgi:hypothetical protein